MKSILLALLLVFTINLSAQTTPNGYDGGSELQKAILKSRSKQTTKTKKPVKHVVTVTELQPPAHTKEEANYYLIYREESPSYLRKLVASDYWKAQQKIADQEEMKGYAERVEKRKKDSLAQEEIRKQNIEAMKKIRADNEAAVKNSK